MKTHCKRGHPRTPDNIYRTMCRQYIKLLRKKWDSPEKLKLRKNSPTVKAHNAARRLKTKYGLTPDDYNSLFTRQNGVCAICSDPPTTTRLAVDHDHSTGKIRGLLCYKCNIGLGHFRDDISHLVAAIKYLQ